VCGLNSRSRIQSPTPSLNFVSSPGSGTSKGTSQLSQVTSGKKKSLQVRSAFSGGYHTITHDCTERAVHTREWEPIMCVFQHSSQVLIGNTLVFWNTTRSLRLWILKVSFSTSVWRYFPLPTQQCPQHGVWGTDHLFSGTSLLL